MTYRLIGVLTLDPSAEKEPKTDVIGPGSSNSANTANTNANVDLNKGNNQSIMIPTTNHGLEAGEVEIKTRKRKKCTIL
jgi:hypothetical protein